MDQTELLVGSYVELLPDRENVYKRAVAGTRGTIRASKRDDFGYQKVYIEWDKAHWRYNGEADGWTLAAHFRPVEDIGDHDLMDEILHEDEPCPHCGEMHGDHVHQEEVEELSQEERTDQYMGGVSQGFEMASESDAFMLITLRKRFDPGVGAHVVLLDMIRGSAIEELDHLSESEILAFLGEYLRRHKEQ